MQAGFILELFNIGVNNPLPPGTTDAQARVDYLLSLIGNGLVILFVVIILLAVVYSAIAGLKYIQSQGDADKVEEAQKALKAVLFGVAAVFLGIIGVVVISSILFTNNNTQVQTALKCFLSGGNQTICTGQSK